MRATIRSPIARTPAVRAAAPYERAMRATIR